MGRQLVFESGPGDFGKNRLINGAFDLFQRQTALVTIGGAFGYQTADRWQMGFDAGDITNQQSGRSSGTKPPGSTSEFVLRFLSDHAGSAGDLQCKQFIESNNVKDLVGKKASFGVWVESNSAETVRLIITDASSPDTFGGTNIADKSIAIPNNSTWIFISVEDILMTANIANGCVAHVLFSNFTASGAGKVHRVGDAIFNEGKIVQPFKRFAGQDIGAEILAAQRYYESVEHGVSRSLGNTVTNSVFYKVRKRVIPVVDVTSWPVAPSVGSIFLDGFSTTFGAGSGGNGAAITLVDAEIS